MRILLILLFSFLATPMSFGRTMFDIHGVVLDMTKNPIAYANVVLLDTDSTFINGCTTDDKGGYSLSNVPSEGMFIKVSAIGYNTKVVKISSSFIPDTLILENKSYQLNEVTIKGNKPRQALTKGGIVTTVKGTVLSIAGNAVDVIAQMPGVRVEDDKISVFGKGTPIIYINGRKLTDLGELSRLSSKEIESVEVLNNPGARYSAEVKSVIIIKTIRKSGEGLSGSAQSVSRLAHSFSQSGNVALNYRHNNIDIFGSFAVDYSKRYQKQRNSTNIDFNQDVYDLESDMTILPVSTSYTANIGFNWQVDKNNTLGIKYEFQGTPNSKSNWYQQEKVFLNGEQQDDITYHTHWDRNMMPMNLVNMYYLGNINHWSFSLNNDYYFSKNTADQDILENSLSEDTETSISSSNHVRNKMFASKGVIGYDWKTCKTEVGYEYTYTDRKDSYLNYGNQLPNSDNHIKEDNFALFASTSIPMGKCELSGGVRYEHTVSDYYENNQLIEEQSRKYNKFYPTLDFSFPIKHVNFSLSYTAKTRRPSYSQLSSNLQYDDRFTYEQGNPLLESEINHDITLEGLYRWLYFSASYQYVKDAIVGIVDAYSEDSPINLMTYVNYKHISKYSALLYLSPRISMWSPRLILNFLGQDFKINAMGNDKRMNNPMLFFNFYNSIKIDKGLTVNGDVIGHTSGDMDVVYMKPSWQINVGVSKTIGNWFFQLNATDLFKTARNSMITYGNQMVLDKWNYSDSRALRLTVHYAFNATSNRYKGSNAGQKEIDRF
jgi:hypothetical protein